MHLFIYKLSTLSLSLSTLSYSTLLIIRNITQQQTYPNIAINTMQHTITNQQPQSQQQSYKQSIKQQQKQYPTIQQQHNKHNILQQQNQIGELIHDIQRKYNKQSYGDIYNNGCIDMKQSIQVKQDKQDKQDKSIDKKIIRRAISQNYDQSRRINKIHDMDINRNINTNNNKDIKNKQKYIKHIKHLKNIKHLNKQPQPQQQPTNKIIHQYSINMMNINLTQNNNFNNNLNDDRYPDNNQQANRTNDRTFNLITSAILNSFIDLKNILKHHIIYLFLPKTYLPIHNNLYYKYGYQSLAILSDAETLEEAHRRANRYHIPFMYIQVKNQKQEMIVRENVLNCFQIAQFLNQNYFVFAQAIRLDKKQEKKQELSQENYMKNEKNDKNDKKYYIEETNTQNSSVNCMEEQGKQQNWQEICEEEEQQMEQMQQTANQFIEDNIFEQKGYLYFFQGQNIYFSLQINQQNLKQQNLTLKLQQNRTNFYTHILKQTQIKKPMMTLQNNNVNITDKIQPQKVEEKQNEQNKQETMKQVSQFLTTLQQNQ